MAKMRGFKPELWSWSKFVRCTPLARLFFLGMWSYACDNGHTTDDTFELKMQILPAEAITVSDVDALVDELVRHGLIERRDGHLKVLKLAKHQRIDTRYLTLCDHCAHDGDTTWTEADRTGYTRGARRAPSGQARSAHDGDTTAARVEGEGEGEGEKKVKESRSPKPSPSPVDNSPASPTAPATARGTRLSEDWAPPGDIIEWQAQERPDLDPHVTLERFRDHWLSQPGAKGRKVDWVRTYRNWVRNERPGAGMGRSGTGRGRHDEFAAAAQRIEHLRSLERQEAEHAAV